MPLQVVIPDEEPAVTDARRPATEETEASFRSSLEDVVTITEKLSPYCRTVEDLLGMVRLALENDGQLHLLMGLVAQPSKRGQ